MCVFDLSPIQARGEESAGEEEEGNEAKEKCVSRIALCVCEAPQCVCVYVFELIRA